jgi:hypothetical protein
MRMCVIECEICSRAELVCAREMMLKTSNKQKMRRRKKTKIKKKSKTNK